MKNEKDMELIKNSSLSKEETNLLREKFVNEYSKNKGWNAKELNRWCFNPVNCDDFTIAMMQNKCFTR